MLNEIKMKLQNEFEMNNNISNALFTYAAPMCYVDLWSRL